MPFRVELERKAIKQLKRLPEDRRAQILFALSQIEISPESLDIRKLQGFKEYFRLRGRIPDIVHHPPDNRIIVFRILPRGRAYE